MWAFLPLLFCLSDSVRGLSYSVHLIEGSPTFGMQVRVQGSDRFGWLVLYRRLPGAQGWTEVQKVYVDRWVLPKVYSLQDVQRGEVGWAYRVVWRAGSQEEELGVYYPYGRLPEPQRFTRKRPVSRSCGVSSRNRVIIWCAGIIVMGKRYLRSLWKFPAPVWKGTAYLPCGRGAIWCACWCLKVAYLWQRRS